MPLHPVLAVAEWFLIGVPLAAWAACAAAAWRQRGRIRLAWMLLAMSGLGWSAAETAGAFFGGQSLPLPAFDLRFAAAVAPAVIALALLPGAPALLADRLRTLFDGLIVAASLVFVSWGTGLGLAYRNSSGDLNSRLYALAHPFGDLVLAVLVTFVIYGAVRTARLSRLLLGLGLLLTVVADSTATWLQFRPAADLFSDLVSWEAVTGFALLAAAAVQEWREAGQSGAVRPSFAPAAAILYLPLVGAAALAGFWQLEGQRADAFLFWNGLMLAGLLVAREILTLSLNYRLKSTFDQRLTARTSELSQSEQRFRRLVDGSPDGVLVANTEGIVRFESESVERVLGRPQGATLGRSWLELVHPDDQARLQSMVEKVRQADSIRIVTEARLSHGDDGWRQSELTLTNELNHPALEGMVISLRDITERRALEDQLSRHALYDPVTALANRALFRDRLQQSVSRAARRREQPSLLLLDIDGLKRVNQVLGNLSGDEILVAVATRLRDSVRASDTVARFGADEFAVLLEDTENEESPASVAQRILNELGRIKVGDVGLTAGIGIAVLAPTAQNPDELLRNADTALAEAKAAGRGKIAVFDRSLQATVTAQRELEADLQRAIERKEFLIHYQPIVRLNDGRPTAVEALVRWMHPWRGMLLPGDFILAAEKTGAIVSLGRGVMLEAGRQVRRWQDQLGLPTLGLAVNLSPRQLQDGGLGNDIRHLLSETGLERSLLMLEVSEQTVLEDLNAAVGMLTRLKDIGANLAIDDCRSGEASLAYLKHLPVDTIKIDRSFVMNLGKARDRSQIKGMLAAGAELNVEMIAEGVEEAGQASDLIAMGCELGQGFHFSKPLAAAQMFDYLDKLCREARAA